MRDFAQLVDRDIFAQMLLQIADALVEYRFLAGAGKLPADDHLPAAESAAAASGFAEAGLLPDNNPAPAR